MGYFLFVLNMQVLYRFFQRNTAFTGDRYLAFATAISRGKSLFCMADVVAAGLLQLAMLEINRVSRTVFCASAAKDTVVVNARIFARSRGCRHQ